MKFVNSYYKVRSLCHQLKDGNVDAINKSATLLSNFLSKGDIVVPMPSHNGNATYMLSVAKVLEEIVGTKTYDILSSEPHEKWYDIKKAHGVNAPMDYDLNVNASERLSGRVFVIDNVYSTGKTLRKAVDALEHVFDDAIVDGLVIGYVDEATIKELHYNTNLHESVINQNKNHDIYTTYAMTNRNQFIRLVFSFLENVEEGEKLFQPQIRSAGTNTKGEDYLRFNRIKRKGDTGADTILFTNTQILDFHYIGELIKLFLFVEPGYGGSFEYNNKGELSYVISMLDTIERDIHGNAIQSNGHPISKRGQHIKRLGTTKSPKGIYTPHNYNGLDMTKSKYGNTWDKYFYPEYYVYNGNQQVVRTSRSKQQGSNSQFPLHWFPKDGKDNYNDLMTLSKMIVSVFRSHGSKRSEALFIAFLHGVKENQFNGYELFNLDKNSLLQKCENIIKGETEPEKETFIPKSYPNNTKYYTYVDKGKRFDDEGHSADSDMEYQIRHLGLESKIRNIFKKLLKESHLG